MNSNVHSLPAIAYMLVLVVIIINIIIIIIIVVVFFVDIEVVGVIVIATTKFRVSRDKHLQLLQKYRSFPGPAACSRTAIQN